MAVSAIGAEAFCRAYGGELPTKGQWLVAAHATNGTVGLPWVTDRLLGCFTDPKLPLCSEYEASAPLPRKQHPGQDFAKLRDVGTTAWDVSPEGVMDLYGNAFEWVRRPSRPYDYATSCDAPAVTEADYYRGPPVSANSTVVRVNVGPASTLNVIWFEWDVIATQGPAYGPIGAFQLWGAYDPTPVPYYRDGFRCVFPKEAP